MQTELNLIKKEIIRILISKQLPSWHKTKLIFDFPPYTNKGYTGSQFFWDKNANEVEEKTIFLDIEASKVFYNFILDFNQKGEYNEMIFSTTKDDYENATIEVCFNQEVEDNFQNNLPKSKRGKTIPWWKNDKYKR